MTSKLEKGGGAFKGIKLLLCENPLPPLDEAIAAAQAEVPRSNYYTEAHSVPLRQRLADKLHVPERLIHINAGSELILRQLFDRFGQQVHLLTPTYPLFPEVAQHYTETRLRREDDFRFDLGKLVIPNGTTLVVIVKAKAHLLTDQLTLHPDWPLKTDKIAAALRDVIADRCGTRRLRALQDMLSRNAPRLRGGTKADILGGADPVMGTVSAVADMGGTVLPIQGPPGTGKTYVTARAILSLVSKGHRVAVSSNSHEARPCLLHPHRMQAAKHRAAVDVQSSRQFSPHQIHAERLPKTSLRSTLPRSYRDGSPFFPRHCHGIANSPRHAPTSSSMGSWSNSIAKRSWHICRERFRANAARRS